MKHPWNSTIDWQNPAISNYKKQWVVSRRRERWYRGRIATESQRGKEKEDVSGKSRKFQRESLDHNILQYPCLALLHVYIA